MDPLLGAWRVVAAWTDHSSGSMLRTIRAAALLLVLGGMGPTVPPQTSDLLAFMLGYAPP